jgi:hypothetical protein
MRRKAPRVLAGIILAMLATDSVHAAPPPGNSPPGSRPPGSRPPGSRPPGNGVPEIDLDAGGRALALIASGALLMAERVPGRRRSGPKQAD